MVVTAIGKYCTLKIGLYYTVKDKMKGSYKYNNNTQRNNIIYLTIYIYIVYYKYLSKLIYILQYDFYFLQVKYNLILL